MCINIESVMNGRDTIERGEVYLSLANRGIIGAPSILDRKIARLENTQSLGLKLCAVAAIGALLMSPLLLSAKFTVITACMYTLAGGSAITGIVLFAVSTTKKREYLDEKIDKNQVGEILGNLKKSVQDSQEWVKRVYRLGELKKLEKQIDNN